MRVSGPFPGKTGSAKDARLTPGMSGQAGEGRVDGSGTASYLPGSAPRRSRDSEQHGHACSHDASLQPIAAIASAGDAPSSSPTPSAPARKRTRLHTAAERARQLRRAARSHLPAAIALARVERLRISPQAALGLLNQLVAAVLKEATGRATWRAFAIP